MTTNGYLRLRQICLVARDLDKAEQDVFAVTGSRPCYSDPNVAKYGLKNALFPIGDRVLEIVVPTREGTAAGRFLERFGARGAYMVIMDCSDVDRRRRHVQSLGIRIVNSLDYDGFTGIQLHPHDARAAILEFNSTVGGETTVGPYYPAGPDWPAAAKQPPTSRLVSLEVEGPDPEQLAAHWARIIETPVHVGGVPLIQLEQHTISFSRAESEARDAVVGMQVAVIDPDASLSAARGRGLLADDGSIWLYGVRIDLVPLASP